MSLSIDAARRIVATVEADAACHAQINSWLRRLPAYWGISGTVRNLGRFVTFQDPSDEKIAAEACTGITIATVKALEQKLSSASGIPEVKSAERIDRYHPNHTATKVTMEDGSAYVFDWHATLNVRNPLIFTERRLVV
jgi:hypothetical protein